jgi:cytochrome c oxidase cbb3-type subunit 3
MSSGLSWYIIGLTAVNVVFIVWLIIWTARIKTSAKEGENMGHEWDGLSELNNPLPRWWLYMFWISIGFTFLYLALYPGLGKYAGALGWTQENQWEEEVTEADDEYGPIFAKLASGSIADIAGDPAALKTGHRLFLNYCSTCHGTAARGAVHFPNLTDDDWLWGGSPEQIHQTILNGRGGIMPSFAAPLGSEEGIQEVVNYVMSLSGRDHDAEKAAAGQQKFMMFCVGCHGPQGKGNPIMGAPNLADGTWLHGRRSDKAVAQTVHDAIQHGFNSGPGATQSRMPSFKDFLGEDKVKVLAAYVYSLSRKGQTQAAD